MVATSSNVGANGLRRARFVVFFVLAGISLFGAAPARAALPGGYVPTAVDDPSTPILASTSDRFGENFANAGDVNGDGKDDLIVGVPNAPDQNNLPGVSGKVVFVSGANGGVIDTVTPPAEPSHAGSPAQFGARVATLGDIGSCPQPPAACSVVGPPDGVPEHVVSAPGADVSSAAVDVGIVYVLDGRTNQVMKRIELAADDQPATPSGFGRGLASPAGEPACQGLGGIGSCPDAPDSPVAVGDVNGDLIPDLIVGAPDYAETADTDFAGCDAPDPNPCPGLGRVYVYSGATITGSTSVPLDSPLLTIKYFDKATASQQPHLGSAIAPIGDVGSCELGPQFVGRSADCMTATQDNAPGNTPDGYPDFLVSAPGLTVNGQTHAGVAFVVDGSLGLVIGQRPDPDPQQDSGFASFGSAPLAAGNLAGGPLPDILLGATGFDLASTDQGRAYVLNGDVKSPIDQYTLGAFDDPLPGTGAKFGASAVGIGDVAGDSPGEVAIGRGDGGPVRIFSPCAGALLQTIDDPDPGTGFGSAIAPMGDLNGDGYLDLAIGAPGFGGGQGRIYLMKSDGSAGPTFAGCSPSTGGGGGGGTTTNPPGTGSTPGKRSSRKKAPRVRALAKRTLKLTATKKPVIVGKLFTLKGRLITRNRSCRVRQKIAIQRLNQGKAWLTINVGITKRTGTFAASTRPYPAQAFYYRARVNQTRRCMGAVSSRVRVVAKDAGV